MNKVKTGSLVCLLVLAITVISSCSGSKKKTGNADVIAPATADSLTQIDGIFDIPELSVSPSPELACSISFSDNTVVNDFDVSPAGPVTAVLFGKKGENNYIRFWQAGQNEFADSCNIGVGYATSAITWHPKGNALFVVAEKEKQYHILRIEKVNGAWAVKSIFSSANPIRRLVSCPRPFIVKYADGKAFFTYRLFFGMGNENNTYRIVSITENGGRFYQVIGPEKTETKPADEGDMPPSTITAAYALPVAFHPSGHQLIWEDATHHYFQAGYDKAWGVSAPLSSGIPVDGSITPTPNGLAFLHWQKGKQGIEVCQLRTHKKETQALQYQFTSTPSSVPDGKGIVGLTENKGRFNLNYVPVKVPLADVVNAWMFLESGPELSLFEKNGGLFRTTQYDQLYQLYESENYQCGTSYERTVPTRPYLVTTDIFWELFGAAYQGLFIVKEREQAMPDFWNFVSAADNYYKKTGKNPKWAGVFAALSEVMNGQLQSAEAQRIDKAEGTAYSEVFKQQHNYTELKPRGHYTADEAMARYFKGFKYFTTAFADDEQAKAELNNLPAEIKKQATQWINSYMGFISPSRTPLVWKDMGATRPAYNHFPGVGTCLFPLSWGFDNEVLYATVYHQNLPAEQQITGAGGPRLTPSGIDLAAAMGNGLAESLLQSDMQQYPPLKKVINALQDNFKANGKGNADNLYDNWLMALSVQWCDTVASANGKADDAIWRVKRLQTGLASWATLRHATGLVNERTAAECGEGGFEEILLRAPRGYVEPDPQTYAAIATLFETAVKYVSESISQKEDLDDENAPGKTTLYTGIIKRLKQTAQDARFFEAIAEKEKRNQEITNEEYEKIFYIGRVAEHCFLIFQSLSNKEYALSTPDPMPKIMDVAGGDMSPFLMAAVGRPLEWENIVPFYGRRQIVKGPVYAYHEFKSEQLINDKEWQKSVSPQTFQPWLKPYVTELQLSRPATTGY